MSEVYHIPALLSETVDGLNISPSGTYVDVTFGGGGHSGAILKRLSAEGRLFSFDQDEDAYRAVCSEGNRLFTDAPNWQFVHGNFRYVKNFMDYYGVPAYRADLPGSGIDGLLADLGVSFHHFDEAERGFSFRFDGPLDMRMNRTGGKTAADILNTYSEEDLARAFFLYGELKNSRALARKIVRLRANKPFETTRDLTAVIAPDEQVESRFKKDLARLFQAIRMEVNDETQALEQMLEGAKQLLKPGGRIAVLTYHSLEDRIVKNFLRSGNTEGRIDKDFYGNVLTPFRLVNRQVIVASDDEVERNPRAPSAKLRIAEKLESYK